jgi:hypothetical protein
MHLPQTEAVFRHFHRFEDRVAPGTGGWICLDNRTYVLYREFPEKSEEIPAVEAASPSYTPGRKKQESIEDD